jgi:hypothetical protein
VCVEKKKKKKTKKVCKKKKLLDARNMIKLSLIKIEIKQFVEQVQQDNLSSKLIIKIDE